MQIGKERATCNSFSFPFFLPSSSFLLNVHVLLRNENNWVSFAQIFYSSGKNKIHRHARALKQEFFTFDDSAYELNALIFAFKTDIAQDKDEW